MDLLPKLLTPTSIHTISYKTVLAKVHDRNHLLTNEGDYPIVDNLDVDRKGWWYYLLGSTSRTHYEVLKVLRGNNIDDGDMVGG